MTKRVQISTVIDPELKRVLLHMCADDLITLREQLENLIREEHQRRQAPANTLIDERVKYVTKDPA